MRYSPGVKANVLFFDKKPVAKAPPTKEIWVYDLRSNRNFSLRQNPIKPKDLTDFINCYRAEAPSRREETDHFRRFTYSEIVARDKVSLDIQLQHDTMKVSQRVPPQALMKEILNDLEEAMKQFAVAEREIRR